jgi:hypothetical protein
MTEFAVDPLLPPHRLAKIISTRSMFRAMQIIPTVIYLEENDP